MIADTLSRVVALVRDVYGTEQPIAADTALDALDGDSLGRVLLVMEVEKAFGVALPARAEEQWTTVADVVAAIEKPRIAGPWITDDAGSTGHYRGWWPLLTKTGRFCNGGDRGKSIRRALDLGPSRDLDGGRNHRGARQDPLHRRRLGNPLRMADLRSGAPACDRPLEERAGGAERCALARCKAAGEKGDRWQLSWIQPALPTGLIRPLPYREDMDDPTRDSLALFAWVDGFGAHRWIVWTIGDTSHVVAQGDGCATIQEAHDAADAAARERAEGIRRAMRTAKRRSP